MKYLLSVFFSLWRKPEHLICVLYRRYTIYSILEVSYALFSFSFLSVFFICILLTEPGVSSFPWLDRLWTGKAVWWCYPLFWVSQNRTTLPIYLIYKPLGTSRTRTLRGTRGMSRRQGSWQQQTARGKITLWGGFHHALWEWKIGTGDQGAPNVGARWHI